MTPRDQLARVRAITVLVLGGVFAVSQHAWAFDTTEVYRRGAVVISGEGGYGASLGSRILSPAWNSLTQA